MARDRPAHTKNSCSDACEYSTESAKLQRAGQGQGWRLSNRRQSRTRIGLRYTRLTQQDDGKGGLTEKSETIPGVFLPPGAPGTDAAAT